VYSSGGITLDDGTYGVRCVVQFEPQPPQIFNIPANTLTFIRPHVFVDPAKAPIERLVVAFKGAPNSQIEIRDWQFDGSPVTSLSYYILGAKEAYGQKRWLAGGFSVKPLFHNLATLKARYADGVSKYNAGYIYN